MIQIYFRTDGSTQTGLGHLVRCIALAQMLKKMFQIVFVCEKIPEKIVGEVNKNGFVLKRIQNESEFFNILKPEDIVVLDGYHFDTAYQKKINSLKCKLVCIDDLHDKEDKEFAADLIINHAPGLKPQDYQAQPYTQFALGPAHALLRPVFLKQASKDRKIDKIETVLICFGGSDQKNVTESTLKVVLEYRLLKKIIVVTGAAYNYLEILRNSFLDNRVKYYNAIEEDELLTLMLEADLAIVPASGILFEALAAGCKIISGYYVDNQKIVARNFKLINAFESAEDFSSENLKKAIDRSFKDIQKTIKIIDGKSGQRNLFNFLNIATSIRQVVQADCKLLFKWANDKDVRKNAINQKNIPWETHVDWFSSKLTSQNSKIFILELKDQPIGQIRYDEKGDHWLIDYSIDHSYRGLGFGKIILEKTLGFFKKNKARGIVKSNNIASINAFTSLNFKKISSELIDTELYHTFQFQV